MNKLKNMFKSFDLIGEGQGLFTAIVLSVAFGLMIAFYISAEDSKKTNVVQTPVVKTQVLTVEDEILALEQIGANLIISKINEKSDKKVSLKLNKEGWEAGIVDGKNKININMEKIK